MENREWFAQAKFGMMVHFGLYSVIGGEWKGERMDYIGEWAQSHFRIPKAEYEQLAKVFKPIYFNRDEEKSKTLFECPATLNKTWGYKAFDSEWKSAERLFEIKESLNARGINYLLNVGPDHLGRIPAPSVDILRELGKKLRG